MKRQSKNHRYLYFKTSLNYLIKNQVVLFILFFLEFVPVYFNIIYSACKLQHGRKVYEENSSFFYYISLYGFYKEYVPTYNQVFIIGFMSVFLIVLIGSKVFQFLLTEEMIENKHFLCEWFKTFMVNFYDLILIRLLNIFVIDMLITVLVKLVYEDIKQQSDKTRIVSELATLLLLLLYIAVLFMHFTHICLWSNIKLLKAKSDTVYPFDMKFSYKYDLIMLLLKLAIVIEKNVYLKNEKLLTIEILVFDLLAVVVILVYFVYMLYLIFFSQNSFLYYQIINVNLLKIFFVLFTGLSLLFRFIISNQKSEIYYMVNMVSFVLFLIFFFQQFKRLMYEIFIRSNDMIGLLVYLISNNNDDMLLISQWMINHKIVCKRSECLCCKEMFPKNSETEGNVTDIPLERFYKIVWSIINKEIRSNKLKLSKEAEVYLDGIELVYYFIKKSHQKLKFSILFYKKLVKYRSLNKTFYSNLQLLFEKVKELNMDFIKCYQNFEESKLLLNEFTSFFTALDNFIKYEGKTHENVMKLSQKLDAFTSSSFVIKKLSVNLGNYSYELFLMRYIYELITHQPLRGTIELFDISNYYEFVDYHFSNDSNILINYGLMAQECIIVKACTELRKYINASFDDIFPRYVKQFGKAEFIKLINRTNFKDDKNSFSFILQNGKEDFESFVESFQFKFVMFPSINTGEVLISGELTQRVSDVMVFSKISQREFLVSFSSQLEKMLCITPEMIEIFAVNQKFLFTDVIFSTKKLTSANLGDLSRGKYYSINFNSYYAIMKQYLLDTADIPEKEVTLKKLIQLRSAMATKVFCLTSQHCIKNSNEEYVIYSVQNEEINENNQLVKTKAGDSLLRDTFTKYMTTTVGQDKMSSSSTSFHTINKLNLRLLNKGKGAGTYLSDHYRLRTIHFVYPVYNFLILVFTIISIVVQLNQTKLFVKYFDLYQAYIDFRGVLDVQILRLSSQFCIVPSLEFPSLCNNNFDIYSKKFLKTYPSSSYDWLMSRFVFLEFNNSLPSIQEHYLRYQTMYFQLKEGKSHEAIEEKEMDIIYVNIEDGKNILRTEKEAFYQGLNIYINLMTQIVNENAVASVAIRFFDYDRNSNILQTGRNGKRQKNLYQILLNYPTIQQSLIEKDLILLSWYEEHRMNISKFLIAFTIANVVLIIAHFTLGTYSLVFCSFVIRQTIELILSKLKTKVYMDYFQSKYSKMKTLIEMYSEKPSSVITAIMKETDEYKKKEIERKKEQDAIAAFQTQPQKKKSQKCTVSFDRSIKITFILAFTSYIILFAFEIGMFFILNSRFELIKTMVSLSFHNANIDYYVYNNLNSLLYMLITNTTEYELSELILKNASVPFVQQAVNDHLYSIKIIDSIRATHADIFSQFFPIERFSCEMIRQTNDSMLSVINAINDTDYFAYVEDLCSKFSIMNFNDSNLIQTNIIYLERKLINSYTQVPYEKKAELITNDVLWDLYATILIFNRIIREAMNNLVMPNVIIVMIERMNVAFEACLISNVFVEVGLVTVLFFLTFLFLMKSNQKIISLLRFLEGV